MKNDGGGGGGGGGNYAEDSLVRMDQNVTLANPSTWWDRAVPGWLTWKYRKHLLSWKLFDTELFPKRYWRRPSSEEVGNEGGDT